ncbi:hypothetical protein NQL31_007052 [Lotmaria passim]
MYKVFPSLILRAAMVRARSLELGGVNDYYTSSSAPSSSTLVAAAPSVTNVYVLAFGEREGLAPGERLEVYGSSVRLIRTLAYGCPRGVTPESAFTGRLAAADLGEITEQLDALHPCGTDMRKLITLQLQRRTSSSSPPSSAPCSRAAPTTPENGDSGARRAAATQVRERTHSWTLRLPPIKNSRVLRDRLPSDAASLGNAQLTAQLERMRRSPEEVVVAEWVSRASEIEKEHKHESSNRQPQQQQQQAAMRNNGELSNTVELTDEDGIPLSAQSANTGSADDTKKNSTGPAGKEDGEEDGAGGDALLMENGVCFRSADSCGLRALRTARLAFISSIERTANGLARRQRRLSGEELRALEVLDVNAIDFTFAHAALQSTLELGLHVGEACRITHVPLTDAAAQKVETQTASYIRVVAARTDAGRALPRPFDFLPTHSFDVGAYTAYLPLPLGPLTAAEAAGSCASLDTEEMSASASRSNSSTTNKSKNTHSKQQQQQQKQRCRAAESGIGGTRLDRQQLAMQLSQAMATLRRGACMLVTFVPTPNTVAALYHEMETQHHAEVLIEHRMVSNSKACIAEAISRTGRWGYITDEVLPAADSPQGSSFSLMVILE